jgi:DNA-binding beta-propeller fold protein YncE
MMSSPIHIQMLRGTIVSNGIGGEIGYLEGSDVAFCVVETGADFRLDLSNTDLLLVPNGSDSVALGRARAAIRTFLDNGGTLICCDGWVTPWVPGNEWVMDNNYRTIDVRYRMVSDRFGVMDGVDVDALTYRHGISGWWACGYINAAEGAEVVVEDSWGRPIIVVDTVTTRGIMALTASGPIGPWAGGDASPSGIAVHKLYDNFLKLAHVHEEE